MKNECISASTINKVVQPVGTLPQTGFVRLSAVLAVYPVSKTTWWQGVRSGRFPAGVKLSENTTAWRVEDIRLLIQSAGV